MTTENSQVRAVRCNNPGNIERAGGNKWQGLMPLSEMTDEQRNEQRFCVFKSPKWGFRALERTLITYQDKRRADDGSIIDTVTDIILRWAPPKENDTEAYIKSVCKQTGFTRNQTLDLHTYADSAPLVKAIAVHECGGWFFSQDDLDSGLRLAGVEKPPSALVQSPPVRATTVAASATGLGLIAEAAGQIAPATSLAREVADYAPTAAAIIVLIALGLTAFYLWDQWRKAQA